MHGGSLGDSTDNSEVDRTDKCYMLPVKFTTADILIFDSSQNFMKMWMQSNLHHLAVSLGF